MSASAAALIVVLIVLMLLGLPITWALGGACICAIFLDPALSLAMITQKIFTGCDNFSMLALPRSFWQVISCQRAVFPKGWWPLQIPL